MKISAALVRRLRAERGWSQDQLAMASGLSLRTIQRVEAEGVASMGTRVSLAATFDIALAELAKAPAESSASTRPAPDRLRPLATLSLGIAIVACALLVESGRLPGTPTASVMLALNLLLGTLGVAVAAPAAWQLLRARRFAGVALSMLGTPLVALLVAGVLVAVLRERAPDWTLLAFGAGGALLLALGWRDVARTPTR
jgi:transcriptional regulator with XRE-family HTH domain